MSVSRSSVFVGLLIGLFMSAEAAEGLSAGELSIRCTNGQAIKDGKVANPLDSALCTITLAAYRDGYVNGTFKGAMAPYLHDPDVSVGVNGVADLRRRIGPVLATSRCGLDGKGDSPVNRLRTAFQAYVSEHPDVSGQHYGTVLQNVIDEKLCNK